MVEQSRTPFHLLYLGEGIGQGHLVILFPHGDLPSLVPWEHSAIAVTGLSQRNGGVKQLELEPASQKKT